MSCGVCEDPGEACTAKCCMCTTPLCSVCAEFGVSCARCESTICESCIGDAAKCCECFNFVCDECSACSGAVCKRCERFVCSSCEPVLYEEYFCDECTKASM